MKDRLPEPLALYLALVWALALLNILNQIRHTLTP